MSKVSNETVIQKVIQWFLQLVKVMKLPNAYCHQIKKSDTKRIDNIVAALLPDERTDLVSTNRLGHGCTFQKLTNHHPCSKFTARMAVILVVIGYHPRSCSRFVVTKAVPWTQWLKGLINAASILSVLLELILIPHLQQ